MLDVFNFGGLFGATYNIIYWIVIAFVIAVPVGLYYYYSAFNINVDIKEFTGSNIKYRRKDKGREIKLKDGTRRFELLWWRDGIFKGKRCNIPPPGAVEVGKRGRKYVTIYARTDGTLVFQVDQTTQKDDLAKIEILDQNDLRAYLDELEKSKMLAGFDWKQYIPLIGSIFVLVVIVVSLVLFFETVIPQFNSAVSNIGGVASQQAELMEQLRICGQNL